MFLRWNAGTENAFLTYAKALGDSGLEVINLVHPKAQIIAKLEENNLRYIKTKFLGRFGKNDLFTILYFKLLIKKHHINLVLAHQGRLISLFKKARNKNVKLIGVNHGHNPKHSVGTDLAITLNSNVFDAVAKLGQDRNKAALLPNGIDLDEKLFITKPSHDKFTIGSYGRFSPEKGHDVLIEALKILNDQNVNFTAIIGGSGVGEKNLQELVIKYNLQDKVRFIGWVLDQEKFFEQVDLFVLPSRREESPLTPLESMKYFVPVLATKNCGCVDLIKDGENGFLTEIDDAKQMAEKIKFIISNRDILGEISKNAYQKLQKSYSYEVFRINLEQIVKDVVNASKP